RRPRRCRRRQGRDGGRRRSRLAGRRSHRSPRHSAPAPGSFRALRIGQELRPARKIRKKDKGMTELRVYLPIEDLQPQFAAYLSSPTRARGYPPFEGQHSLIIEVAPALAIHRITDLALKSNPAMEPGILYTERQFGLLEL